MPEPLRLILDLQSVQSQVHGVRGIGRYCLNLAQELIDRNSVSGMVTRADLEAPRVLDELTTPECGVYINTPATFRSLWKPDQGNAAYVIMSPFELLPSAEPFVPRHITASGIPLVVILYDVIPLQEPERYLAGTLARTVYSMRLRLLRRADIVVTISESARCEALHYLDLDPDKVFAIGTGVAPTFHEEPEEAPVENEMVCDVIQNHKGKYLLTLLGNDRRKNLSGLLCAYARMPEDLRHRTPLVVCGEYPLAAIKAYVRDSPLSEKDALQVVFPGRLEDSDLRHLYQHAGLFVFPSLLEGFGLPAAEAAASGCPVVVSNISSLPEVIGWEPARFDPRNPEQMADVMVRGLQDESYRKGLLEAARVAAALHCWQNVADRFEAAVRDRLSAQPPQTQSHPLPLRLAFVGPLSPARSGIADYNTRLICELERDCEVDVYVPDARSLQVPNPFRRTRRMLLNSLPRRRSVSEYDLVVYSLGNSDHHATSLEKFREIPGVVWLHDVRLFGLYFSVERLPVSATGCPGPDDRSLARFLDREYPGEREARGLSDADTHALGVLMTKAPDMTREVYRDATAVVVHSEKAAERLRRESPEVNTPIWKLPLAARQWNTEMVSQAEPHRWICVFGLMGPAKAPEEVVKIFAELKESFQELRLAFVGHMNPDSERKVWEVCGERGLSKQDIIITGFVNEERYGQWLRRCQVAVFRRQVDHGENSAAANDCLSCGVPTVSNLPSHLELPEGVLKVLPLEAAHGEWVRTVSGLLADRAACEQLSKAARAYAASVSFSRVAKRFLSACRECVTSAGPTSR